MSAGIRAGSVDGGIQLNSVDLITFTASSLTFQQPVTFTGTSLTIGVKTLTLTNSLTFAGTDGTTMTFPTTSATIARTDAANTFTGHQTIEGVTSTGATGTGNLVFSASPTMTGILTVPSVNGVMANCAGYLPSVTNIANQQTPTTGGVTLTSQIATTGQMWRVRAFGTYVAAASGTARNAVITPYWGSTPLVAISEVVLISVAQTTNWECEFLLSSSTTTAVWTAGYFMNKVDTPAIVAGTSTFMHEAVATAATTVVTSGALTIDLRFSTSASVSGDAWNVQGVTMERIM